MKQNTQGVTMRLKTLIISWFLLCESGFTAIDFIPTTERINLFSAGKARSVIYEAEKNHETIPIKAKQFIDAATTGDVTKLSRIFDLGPSNILQEACGRGEGWVQWEAIRSVYGVQRAAYIWGPEVFSDFCENVFLTLPPGSVFIGTSEFGPFILDFANWRSESNRVFVISPNLLSEPGYLDYVRKAYDTNLWLPSTTDQIRVLGGMVQSVAMGILPPNLICIEGANIYPNGFDGKMEMNKQLTKDIFDQNSRSRAVFLEEGLAFRWMYPYLEPSGMLMRLNSEPLHVIPRNVIEQDYRYWNNRLEKLMNLAFFKNNNAARFAYAKMRSAIANLYVYRELNYDAERAFKQAIAICPSSPHANLGLMLLYAKQDRLDKAEELLVKFNQVSSKKLASEVEEELNKNKILLLRKKELEEKRSKEVMEFNLALELTGIYRKLDMNSDFEVVVNKMLSSPMPSVVFESLAKICDYEGRLDLLITGTKQYAEKNSTDLNGISNLAFAYLLMGQQGKALETLKCAIDGKGDEMRIILRQDNRFDILRNNQQFNDFLK